MRKNYFNRNLLALFRLLTIAFFLSSCTSLVDKEDNPATQQTTTTEEESTEDNSIVNLLGKINMPTSDVAAFLQNCKVISVSEEADLDGESFDIDVPSDKLVHTFMVMDEDENVYLLARTANKANNEITLDVESSAIALASLHPLFGPLYGNDFTTIANKIKWSAKYQAFYKEVDAAVKQHQNLFDSSNEALIEALDALYDDVLADIDLDIFNNYVPVAATRPKTRAAYSSPNIPSAFMYADITGKVLTLQCTGLTPSYYGTVKIASTGESKSYTVTSRSDYGGMDIFKPYDQFDLGDKCTFTFTEEGEYYFNLSRITPEATLDFYMRLANTILGTIGIDLGDQTVIQEIATIIANALKDAGLTAMGPDQAEFRDWFGIAYGATLDYLGSNNRVKDIIAANNKLLGTLFIYARILRSAWNVYGKIKGAVNATARIAYLAAAPEEINFYLCCFNGTVDSCSGAQLTIVSGDAQEGKAETQLEMPLTVLVKPLGGSKISSSYSVKFDVVSGGGTLDTEMSKIQSTNKAENYWTLGKEGEQQVRAVVIDAITNKEISEPTYFSATIKPDEDPNEDPDEVQEDNQETDDQTSDDNSTSGDNSEILWGSIINILAEPRSYKYHDFGYMQTMAYHTFSFTGSFKDDGGELRYGLYFICEPNSKGHIVSSGSGYGFTDWDTEHAIKEYGVAVNGSPFISSKSEIDVGGIECILLHDSYEYSLDYESMISATEISIPLHYYWLTSDFWGSGLRWDAYQYEETLPPGDYNICLYVVVDGKTYYSNSINISLPNWDSKE